MRDRNDLGGTTTFAPCIKVSRQKGEKILRTRGGRRPVTQVNEPSQTQHLELEAVHKFAFNIGMGYIMTDDEINPPDGGSETVARKANTQTSNSNLEYLPRGIPSDVGKAHTNDARLPRTQAEPRADKTFMKYTIPPIRRGAQSRSARLKHEYQVTADLRTAGPPNLPAT